MPAAPLNKLGRYELIREIARSNDIVYEAWDPQTQRRVAVKALNIPHGASAMQRQDRILRFEREARAAARLHHPNVVTLFDFGTDEEQPFLVFEFIDGPTLADILLQKGPLNKGTAVNYACQILAALNYAHSQGVIHRDIKPSNIFVCTGDHLKISDLGIARIESEASVTTDGQIFGTPAYMAPEQVKGGQIDRRVDIWSAGTVLYQMVSGTQAFSGGSVLEIGSNVLNKEPDLGLVRDGVIRMVIAKALAKDPSQRYSTAAEMIADLQTPAPAVAVAPAAPTAIRSAAPAQSQPTVAMQPPTIPKPSRKRMALLWAGTCVAAACLGAGVVAWKAGENQENAQIIHPLPPQPSETVSPKNMQQVLTEALTHQSIRDLAVSDQFRLVPKSAQLDQLDTWCRSIIGKDYLSLSPSWRTILIDSLYQKLGSRPVEVNFRPQVVASKSPLLQDSKLKQQLDSIVESQPPIPPVAEPPSSADTHSSIQISVLPPKPEQLAKEPPPSAPPVAAQPAPAATPEPIRWPDQRAKDLDDAEVLKRLHFAYDHVRVLPGGTREYSGPSGTVRIR